MNVPFIANQRVTIGTTVSACKWSMLDLGNAAEFSHSKPATPRAKFAAANSVLAQLAEKPLNASFSIVHFINFILLET
jgi:hypothetical protein